MLRICKANVLHLDENIAAVWVWLNVGISDDLQTNVLNARTKSQNVRVTEQIYFALAGHHCRDITRNEAKCIAV